MTSNYVSLHNHTDNSMLDGFSTNKQYIEKAIELGQPAVGTSDHGNVFGSLGFLREAQKAGITGVPGCEFYVAPINPDGARALKPIFYGRNGVKVDNDVSSNGAYLHLTVWAYNSVGLHNLFRLSTMSNHKENFYFKPRIDLEMLAEFNEGLIVATGCPSSEISTRFLLGQDYMAHAYAGRLKEIFGDRLFVEIMDHNMSIDLERILLPKQVELSKKLGIPLLATNDCHYADHGNAVSQEEMLCIQSGSRMSEKTYDEGGSRFAFSGDQFYMKSADQMNKLFPHNDFPDAVKNTLLIAEMASDISLDYDPTLKPKPVIPKEFNNDEVAYYKHLIQEGYKKRYGNADRETKLEAIKRNKMEMEVFYSSDFIGYMLVVYDYLNWTKEKFSTKDEDGNIVASSLGDGRGSVGGSIHAYQLGITEVDPIRHDLIFERFLSPGRGATYEVQYSDGSSEKLVVSEQKIIERDGNREKAYIHQLRLGDVIAESRK